MHHPMPFHICYNVVIDTKGTIRACKNSHHLSDRCHPACSFGQQQQRYKKERIQKAVQKELEKEKKYAKEQRFYNADEYDFKAKEIDSEALKSIEAVEPDYAHTDDWGACDNN